MSYLPRSILPSGMAYNPSLNGGTLNIGTAAQIDSGGGDDTPPQDHGRVILWPSATGVDSRSYFWYLDDDSGCHRLSRSDADGLFDVIANTDCVHVAAAIEQPNHIDLELSADSLASGVGTPHGIFIVPNPSDETGDIWLNYRQVDGRAMGGNIHMTGTSVGIGDTTAVQLGFYGTTPVAQQAAASQAAVSTTASTQTTPFGYSTQAQADGIITLLNEIRSTLVTVGLIKGSA